MENKVFSWRASVAELKFRDWRKSRFCNLASRDKAAVRNSRIPMRNAIRRVFCSNHCKKRLINYIFLDVISAGLLSESRQGGGSIYLHLIFYVLLRDNFLDILGKNKSDILANNTKKLIKIAEEALFNLLPSTRSASGAVRISF